MKRKHSLRSLLSMVCVIAMIVSMVPVLPAAAADVFYDNMESYTVGTDLYTQAGDKYTKTSPAWGSDSYTAADQGSVAVVVDPVNGNNKVLAVTTAGENKRYVLSVGPEVTGDYTLQFDYMPANAVSNFGSGFLDVYVNDGKNQIARLNYRDYGSYFYLDGSTSSEMAKNSEINKDNTWYSVRVVVSEKQYVMDIWEKGAMDTTKISTTATKNFKANAGTNVEFCFGPYLSGWGADTSKPITNYIDNIRIAPGVVEASDAAKDDGSVTVSGGGMIEFADADKIKNKEAVAITAGMGIFAGKEGNNFDPEGQLTRAEMATVIVKMLRGNAFNADNFKGYNKFPDTADYQGGWAEGYINACVQMGVVSGYGDGTFQPGKAVTTAEALTMIINALKVDAGEGEWPATIMAKAQEMKLYGDLETEPDTYDVLTRDQLAVLTYEGMRYSPSGVTGYRIPGSDIVFTDLGDAVIANGRTAKGIAEVVGEDSLLSKVYKMKIAEGIITENQENTDNKYTVLAPVLTDEDGVKSLGEGMKLDMPTKLSEVGHYVTVYYREAWENESKPGVVYNYVDETAVVKVEKKDISTVKAYKEVFGQNYQLAGYVLKVNDKYEVTGLVKKNAISSRDYKAGSVAKTGTYLILDGEIMGYIAPIPVVAAQVRAVNDFEDTKEIQLTGLKGSIPNSELEDRVREYDGIKKGDYVTYVVLGSGSNAIYVLSKTTSVKGVVEKTSRTAVNRENVITIGGTDYVQFGGTNNITDFEALPDIADPTKDPDVSYNSDSYVLYLTEDGKYVGYEKVEGGLDLKSTVFIVGELGIGEKDAYGRQVYKTYARGINMEGAEVKLPIKVQKNGTLEGENYYNGVTIADGESAPVVPNTFYTYKLSDDNEDPNRIGSTPKKEGLYKLTAYSDTYEEKESPIYSGTGTIDPGATYRFDIIEGSVVSNGKTTYKNTGAVLLLMEGVEKELEDGTKVLEVDAKQSAPLTALVKSSWSDSTNTSGAAMKQYYLFSRNSGGSQMLDVAVVLVKDVIMTAGTQVYYVSESGRTPAGLNDNGNVYNVYDYKTGAEKQITLKSDDPELDNGKFKSGGYWHTMLDEDGTFSKVVGKVSDTGSLRGDSGNVGTSDLLLSEAVVHGQKFVELVNNQLTTTGMTNGRGASSAIVVDTRTDKEITNDGIGKITSLDRIAALGEDYPEIVVEFDLCYSTGSDKMHTIFVTKVYFTSLKGGAEFTKEGNVYRLDGNIIDVANMKVTDLTDTTGKVTGSTVTEMLDYLVEKSAQDDVTVSVTYTMKNGKVVTISVNTILTGAELYNETMDGYAVGEWDYTAAFVASNVIPAEATEDAAAKFEIVDLGGGNKALKVSATGGTSTTRTWLSTAEKFSGSYTVEARLMVNDQGGITNIRIGGIRLPNSKGETKDYDLRFGADGQVHIELNPVSDKNAKDGEVVGTTTQLLLYKEEDGTQLTAASTPVNNWYKAEIMVNADNNTVTTVLKDAEGTELGRRVLVCDALNATSVGFETQSEVGETRETYWDYFKVTEYKPPKYDVTLPAEVDSALVTMSKTTGLYAGDTVSFTVDTLSTYTVDTVTVTKANGGEVAHSVAGNKYTFTMPEADVTIAVTTRLRDTDKTVTVTKPAGGQIKVVMDGKELPIGEAVKVMEGKVLTITATPDDANAYKVGSINVTGKDPIAASTYEYTMGRENVTITATIVDIPYYVPVVDQTGGTVTFEGTTAEGKDGYKEGTDLTITATADGDHVLKAIYVNGKKYVGEDIEGGKYVHKLDGAVKVVADFWHVDELFREDFDGYVAGEFDYAAENSGFAKYADAYLKGDVKFETGDDGAMKVSVTGGTDNNRSWLKTSKAFGDSYVIEARLKTSANSGLTYFRLPGINVNGKDYQLRFEGATGVYVYADAALATLFTPESADWYTVKIYVNADTNTVITEVSDGTTTKDYTVKNAVLSTGAIGFETQSVDGQTRETKWDYITVSKYPTYTVTAGDCTNGSVSFSSTTAKYGSEVTVIPNPAEGYEVGTIKVNGVDIDGYTFVLTRDTVVTATFNERQPYTAKIGDHLGGTLKLNGGVADVTDYSGETVAVTATADSGYTLNGVYVNGVKQNTNDSFEMPKGGAIVTADFVPTNAKVHDGFIGYVVDKDYDYTAPGAPFVKNNIKGTTEFKVVNEDGAQALKVSATGATGTTRTWLETRQKFSGSYMIQARIKANDQGSISNIRVPGLRLPNYAGSTKDYELRFKADGSVVLALDKVSAANVMGAEVAGTDAELFLYKNGAKVTADQTPVNNWYTVEIYVNDFDGDGEGTSGNVITVLKNNSGVELGRRTLNGAKINSGANSGAVGFETQSTDGQTRVTYLDYLTVKENPTYTVTEGNCEHGKVTVSNKNANYGAEVTITAHPDAGYAMDEVEGYTVTTASGNPVDVVDDKFIMPAENVTVTAAFKQVETYVVTISAGTHGTVTVKYGSNELESGDKLQENAVVAIAAVPDYGYEIDDLMVMTGGGPVSFITDTTNFKMPAEAVTISVTFKEMAKKTVTINNTTPSYGSVSVTYVADTNNDGEDETITVNNGDQVYVGTKLTVTATPATADGHALVELDVNGTKSATSPYQFTLTADATVAATFKEKGQTTLNVFSDGNGTVKLFNGGTELTQTNGQVKVAEGTTITVTAEANSGYVLKGIYTDGVKLTGTSFTATDEDAVINIGVDFWPEGATFHEGFDRYANGGYDYTSSDACMESNGTNTKGNITVEVNDGTLKTSSTGAYSGNRVSLQPKQVFSGDYTVEVRFNAEELGRYSVLTLDGLLLKKSSGTGKYVLRLSPDEGAYIYLSKVSSDDALTGGNANETAGTTNKLYMYSDGTASGTQAAFAPGNTWYTLKIKVSDTDKKVTTELYDDNGLLGSRALTIDTVDATAVNIIDVQATNGTTSTIYWDYITVYGGTVSNG